MVIAVHQGRDVGTFLPNPYLGAAVGGLVARKTRQICNWGGTAAAPTLDTEVGQVEDL